MIRQELPVIRAEMLRASDGRVEATEEATVSVK